MKKIYIASGIIATLLLTLCVCLFFQHQKDTEKIKQHESNELNLLQQYNSLNNEYQLLKEEYEKQQLENTTTEVSDIPTIAEIVGPDASYTQNNSYIQNDSYTSEEQAADFTKEQTETSAESSELVAEVNETITNSDSIPPSESTTIPIQKTYSYSWGQTLKYVAIGNSITVHGENEYWWNNAGMSATSKENDYVHLVEASLKNLTGSASARAYNFYPWEIQVHDRAETFSLIDFLLEDMPDIITLQLSENVIDMSHYQSDWEELIRYIQGKCPNAQIIVIDDFWYGGNKSTLKKKAADNTGVQFVSLSAIRDNALYQCGVGTTVYDADGNPHTIEHEGVAIHPGDLGMQYIANGIMAYIYNE